MSSIRTFVAVDVADSVRQRAAQLIDLLGAGGAAHVKWVAPQNMHLTLKFLGDVPQAEVNAVCQAVAGAVDGAAPFVMRVQGVGAFPHIGRPSTIWIGVDEGARQVGDLQQVVEKALKPLGFPRERRAFHPHLTLGRIRRGGTEARGLSDGLRQQQGFDAGETKIDQVTVYASYLDKTGPTYQAMSRVPLTG
jgi:2'-5' RNA ligase